MDREERFSDVVIEEAAAGTPLAKRVAGRFPAGKVRVVPGGKVAAAASEESLVVALGRGGFLRPCPGSPGMLCCNLHVLDIQVGCPYDCTFCFLKAYRNSPGTVIYADFMDAMDEIRASLREGEAYPLRVTTGELADSLALEDLTGMAASLVSAFGRAKGALLELKTKSVAVDSLLSLDHGGRVVISWSLSPSGVAEMEERGTPSPPARLDAAARVLGAGYGLAFHLDPVFLFQGWQESYTALIDAVFERFPPEAVRWISLGGFRFTASLKKAIRRRFPDSRIFLGEFVPCGDGKYRYFAPSRVEMYRKLRRAVLRRAPRTPVYACMEASHVWKKAFGGLPLDNEVLKPLFTPYKVREESAPFLSSHHFRHLS